MKEIEASTRSIGLSEETRELLELLLREESIELPQAQKIPRRQTTSQLPLSFAQQRLWFLDQLQPETSTYNMAGAFSLEGKLDLEALEKAINEIVNRHEALRTTFEIEDGEPVQVVSPPQKLSLPLMDLSRLPGARREAQALALATEEARLPFDLARGPLMRVKLLRLATDQHVMLLTTHHIISDGWSVGVFVEELGQLYKAFSLGEPSPLPELPIQYADFAIWQRQWLQGETLENELSYWRSELAGSLSVLELPADRPRPAVQSPRGAHQPFVLPKSLTEALRSLSQQHEVTLFMLLLAGFNTLLYRYTGQENILVGTPTANRDRADINGLIGFFVNTLILRTDISGNPGFREVLSRVRKITLEAYDHADTPFEKLVEELQPERDLSYSPIFQVSFALNNEPLPSLEVLGLRIKTTGVQTETAKFDLLLEMTEEKEGLAGWIQYSTDLFDATTIERMTGHFQTLLEAIVGNPDLNVSDFPLMSSQESHLLLTQFNDTFADFPLDSCIHHLFEQQVALSPQSTAVVFERDSLSYQQLNSRANLLAHHLISLGVDPDSPVAVCLDRSLDMVVAILAILKAGAAYLPLDPALPPERLSFILEDTLAAVILTQQHLAGNLPVNRAQMICVDSDWQQLLDYSSLNPQTDVDPDNLAYIIYTSGSTGLPKGAMLPHRGVVNRLLWGITDYRLGPEHALLNKTPLSFDVSVWEIFAPLLSGARLIIARPDGQRDSSYLVDLIHRQQVTHIDFVPSMLQVFLDDPDIALCDSLMRVTAAGESLSAELVDRFHRLSPADLYNLYGPTEASLAVTFWLCKPLDTHRVIPIGRPMSNASIYILGNNLQPVPVGVKGELYIGGVAPGRGYLNRPDLTAQAFTPDPFTHRQGARLYKTGDLAKYRVDGAIEFLGRIDHQVKVRGYRIELGEIEAVLCQHSGIQEAVVVARDYSSADKRIVAYLVPDQQRASTVRQLLSFEKQGLPDYLQPYDLPNGMTVILQNKNETDLVYKEIFQDNSYLKHGIELHAQACVFDVGANTGLFTLFVSRIAKNPTIYAFEPIPPLHELLRINTSLYGLNIKLFDCGLSDKEASDTFTYYPHASVISGRYADDKEDREVVKTFLLSQQEGVEQEDTNKQLIEEMLEERLSSERYVCRLTTISQVIRDHAVERIDLLKIDVEKSEKDVLEGIDEQDWAKIRQVVVEVHDIEGRLGWVKDLLNSQGYKVIVEQDRSLKDTGLYNVYATRSREQGVEEIEGDYSAEAEGEKDWNSIDALIGDVKRHVMGKLSDYMVPSAYVLLDEMPLTANGKVDREKLPAPEEGRTQKGQEYAGPQNEDQQILAEIWQEVLAVERVGINDNFFELGGHSLLGIQLVSRVRKLMRIELPLRNVFEAPTIAAFSQLIEKAKDRGNKVSKPEIAAVPRNQYRNKASARTAPTNGKGPKKA
jgi:amino acid adenylation domain-containing protein/FkbM family methyltransferase